MKTSKSIFRTLLAMVLFAGITLSCSKDDDEKIDTADPVIGVWNLRAVHDGEQTVDVTDQACFRDSRFVIDARTMNLTLSIPDEGVDGCQTETITSSWINENGTYYLVDGDQRQQANIVLNDNNQTLQMVINANGQQVGLIFRK